MGFLLCSLSLTDEIHGTPLDDPWLEIDFPRDIEIAKNIIKTIPT